MSETYDIFDCLRKCIDQQSELSVVVKQCMSHCQPAEYRFRASSLWIISLYIGGAALVCMIAMATDLFNGFRMKKSWFPCKYFTLNPAISAVLAIAMKMSVDVSTSMPCGRDQIMKLSGTALMSVSMANFMPSLAVMSDPELFANLTALAVFIVPLVANIFMQFATQIIYYGTVLQHITIIFCIIIQFALLVSTAIACPSMKNQLNKAYEKEARADVESSSAGAKPKMSAEFIKKQWIMAQTSNPQFAIARSVICTASGAICVLTVLILAETVIQLYFTMKLMFFFPISTFEWSGNLIVVIQVAAVLVGSISPISRWFTVVWFKFEGCTKLMSFMDFCTVEKYWTERLKELKKSSLGLLNLRHVRFSIFIRIGKVMVLNLFIMFQTFTVLSCKFVCLVSLIFLLPYIFVYKIIVLILRGDKKNISDERKWVLKLEKEPDLPESTINKIISVVDGNFNKGTKKAVHENQISLLKKSDGFDGINEFDRNLIEELTKMTIHGVSNNPNGRWAIRIVTLSTIVCAIKTTWDKEFVSMVNNILPHVRYIEKALGATATATATQTNNNYIDLGEAAINMWQDVLCSKKWLKTKLPIKSNTTLKMKLETLKKEEGHGHRTAVAWMNKTVEIVIMFLDREKKIEEQQVHHQMTRMVLDILVACLVNLGRAITVNISNASIEKKELVVRRAASIFVETVEIQKLVEERFSSIIDSPDHEEYVYASWWKTVTLTIPPEDAIKRSATSLIYDDEHRIDVESKSMSKDNNEHESKQQDDDTGN